MKKTILPVLFFVLGLLGGQLFPRSKSSEIIDAVERPIKPVVASSLQRSDSEFGAPEITTPRQSIHEFTVEEIEALTARVKQLEQEKKDSEVHINSLFKNIDDLSDTEEKYFELRKAKATCLLDQFLISDFGSQLDHDDQRLILNYVTSWQEIPEPSQIPKLLEIERHFRSLQQKNMMKEIELMAQIEKDPDPSKETELHLLRQKEVLIDEQWQSALTDVVGFEKARKWVHPYD